MKMIQDIVELPILIVEDFKTTRKAQVRILEELGFRRIIEADNGESAMLKLQEDQDIGLIISDWNMPRMNGYEFLVQIRSEEKYKHIPFVMATAQGEKKQALTAMEAGANGFITKPYTAQELKSIIENTFEEVNKSKSPVEAKKILSGKDNKKVRINAAHIQITDHLVLGVLKHLIGTEELKPRYFELNTLCLPSWNPIQHLLETGEADAAFILAPLAMDLFNFGVPVNLVLFSHKNGSICVRNRRVDKDESLHHFFKSRIFFLPHTMSIHHMLSDMFLREMGLTLGPVGKADVNVFFEVVPPVKMSDFLLKNPNACGFAVAEPFGTKAIQDGVSELMFLSGDLWENHPCCVVAMRKEFIETHEDAAYEFVQMLVEAGQFVAHQPETAAKIAHDFLDPNRTLGLNQPLFHTILTQPSGIRTDDLFPVLEDLDKIQRYMNEKMQIGSIIDLEKFVDTRFAKSACKNLPLVNRVSIIHEPANILAGIIKRQVSENRTVSLKKDEKKAENLFEITRKDTSVTFVLSSQMTLVDRMIQEAKGFLKQLGFEAFSGFKMILRELLINAVEHGNKNIPSKKVTCAIELMEDSTFKIIVSDEGDGFDYRNLDMSLPKDTSNIRKRGYIFIHAFSEKIRFNEKGNQITVFYTAFHETVFDTRKDGDRMMISPSGDITASSTKTFTGLLKKLIEEGYVKYRFDFSKVRDIDSVGLSAFIVLDKLLTKKGANKDLEIINANSDIVNLFRMINMDKSYRVKEV